MVRRIAVLTLALLGTACAATPAGGAGPDPNAAARLMRLDELAAGTLDALPTGTQFVRVQLFRQPAGSAFPSKKHQAGIIYQQSGTQVLMYSDGSPQQPIAEGTGLYLRSVEHSHLNNGSSTNAWYNFALWPSAQRAAPLTAANASIPFETADIPASALAAAAYTETLRRVTLQAGGRSPSHRFGGLELIFVLDGALAVKVHGSPITHLAAQQGLYVPPDTASQETATGGPATYLAFFVSPQGQAFEKVLSTEP